MISIGIDPGWQSITIGVVEGNREKGYKKLFSHTFRIKKPITTWEERTAYWEGVLEETFKKFAMGGKKVIVALEIPDYLRGWVKNQRSLMKLALAAGTIWGILNHLQYLYGFVIKPVDRSHRETFDVAPTKAKALARCEHRGWAIKNDHEADALMMALYGMQTI